MGLLSRLKQYIYDPSNTRNSLTPSGDGTGYGVVGYSTTARSALANAYRHPVVCIVVDWLVKQVSSTPLALVREPPGGDQEDITQHPLLTLLNNPSPFLSGRELLAVTVRDLLTSPCGQAFWKKEPLRNGRVQELSYLQSRRVVVRGDRNRLISHYDYSPDMGGPVIRYEPEEIVHIRIEPDPFDPKNGLSPLLCVATELALDLQLQNYLSNSLVHQGAPGGLLMPPESEKVLPEPVVKATQKMVDEEFKSNHKGRIGVLRAFMNYINTGLDPKSMAISELQDTLEERICGALGVHPVVVGLGAGSAQSRVGAATNAFITAAWNSGAVPIQETVGQQVQRQLLPNFVPPEELEQWRIVWDRSRVLALQPDQLREAQRLNLNFRGGGITRYELKTAQGFEATDADRIYLVPSGVVPTPEDAEPLPPLPPDEPPDRDGPGDGPDGEMEDAGKAQPYPPTPRDTLLACLRSKAQMTEGQRRLILALQRDAQELQKTFADELEAAFEELGELAELAFWEVEGGAAMLEDDAGLGKQADDEIEQARRIFAAMGFAAWEAEKLVPAWEANLLRTAETTFGTINSAIGLGVNLSDEIAREILASGGTRLGLVDISTQTRDTIYRALVEGHAVNEGPIQMGRRIRQQVPAGRFVNAGSGYRAELIARTEVKHAQNVSSMEAYRASQEVDRLLVFDAQLGDTDSACQELDGEEVTFEEAEDIGVLGHPNCTRSFAPVIDEP